MSIVQKWKGYDVQEKPEKAKILAEAFISENGKYDKLWSKFDNDNGKTGMMDVMDAHQFVAGFIQPPASTADDSAVQEAESY